MLILDCVFFISSSTMSLTCYDSKPLNRKCSPFIEDSFFIVGHTDTEIDEWRGSSSVCNVVYVKPTLNNLLHRKSYSRVNVVLCTYLTGREMQGDSTGTWNKDQVLSTHQHNKRVVV